MSLSAEHKLDADQVKAAWNTIKVAWPVAHDAVLGVREQWIRSRALDAAVYMSGIDTVASGEVWPVREIIGQAVIFEEYIRDGYIASESKGEK